MAKGVTKFNLSNETIQRRVYIIGVDDCNQLVIAVEKYKEHDDKMKEVLAKEEILMEARNEHAEVMKSYEYVSLVVKSVANAHYVVAHPTDGSYPKHMNRPNKKQRYIKRQKLLQDRFVASSFNYSSMNQPRRLD